MTFLDHTMQSVESRTQCDAERWLAAIVESSEDAIVSETLTGDINSWNAGAERIFGYTREEIIGKNVRMLVWPGYEGDTDLLLEQIRNGQRVDHLEVLRRHKDGSKLYISLSLSPLRDDEGNLVGIAKIARNVTPRRLAEQALHESHEALEKLKAREQLSLAELIASRRLRELIENAPDAILEIDAAGNILTANKTAETMFGYSHEELVDLGIDALVPASQRSLHGPMREVFAQEGASRRAGWGLDLAAVRKDGTEVPVEISLSPIVTSSGTHTIAVVRDTSVRKRAEHEVQILQQSYMRELENRQKEAERLNRLKSEFLASVSHELRTPLHTIIGFAQLLAEQSEGPLNEAQQRFLTHIQRDSEHLLGLINDVLDLSRIEAGGLTLHQEAVNLTDAIEQAVEAIRPLAAARSVRVHMDKIDDPWVQADSFRLRQVLNNLLHNAVKFTPPDGSVSVGANSLDSKFVEVSVSDTGIGIPDDELERIFEKFHQVGMGSAGVREGTGLGLAICKQLVEMHGGEIYAKSRQGHGSRFIFTLPTVACDGDHTHSS